MMASRCRGAVSGSGGRLAGNSALFFFFLAPRRGLRAGHDAGDIGVFGAILLRALGSLQLGVLAPLFLFLALFRSRTLFGSLFEGWSGAVRHGSLLKGHL